MDWDRYLDWNAPSLYSNKCQIPGFQYGQIINIFYRILFIRIFLEAESCPENGVGESTCAEDTIYTGRANYTVKKPRLPCLAFFSQNPGVRIFFPTVS